LDLNIDAQHANVEPIQHISPVNHFIY